MAEELVAMLEARDDVERVEFAGSLRRFRETIGDVDLLVAATDPTGIMDAFTAHRSVHEVRGHGDTKSSIVTHDGLQVDLRVVRPEAFGAALLYFTGSKAHNIRLRQRAIARGWKLSEYALEDAETGEVVAASTEEDVYAALGLAWITPEQREDVGEVEAGRGTRPRPRRGCCRSRTCGATCTTTPTGPATAATRSRRWSRRPPRGGSPTSRSPTTPRTCASTASTAPGCCASGPRSAACRSSTRTCGCSTAPS